MNTTTAQELSVQAPLTAPEPALRSGPVFHRFECDPIARKPLYLDWRGSDPGECESGFGSLPWRYLWLLYAIVAVLVLIPVTFG